jgi:hypothetical protein
MKFDMEKFAYALSQNDFAALLPYKKQIPPGTTVQSVIDKLKELGLESRLVDRHWSYDDPSLDGYFVIKNGNHYEFFRGERGGKHWLEKYRAVDEALFVKVESLLSVLGNRSPDAGKMDSKRIME